MPLPKPPAKPATLLSAADFDSQAAPQPGKRPQKTRAAAELVSPAVVELYEPPTTPGAAIAKSAPVIPARAPVAPRRLQPETRARKPRGNGPATLFVLDIQPHLQDGFYA